MWCMNVRNQKYNQKADVHVAVCSFKSVALIGSFELKWLSMWACIPVWFNITSGAMCTAHHGQLHGPMTLRVHYAVGSIGARLQAS